MFTHDDAAVVDGLRLVIRLMQLPHRRAEEVVLIGLGHDLVECEAREGLDDLLAEDEPAVGRERRPAHQPLSAQEKGRVPWG